MPRLAGAPETWTGEPERYRRRSLLLLVLALVTAALPLLGLARRLPAAQKTDYSIGDLAIIEVGVLEASRGERLVGQASRFGFYQVGPSHFYLQVPLYRLVDRARFSLSLTCLLVNWASLLGVLYALDRWLDTSAALFVAPLVAVPYFGYYESATLFNYWCQYLIVFPAALFLLAAAAVATGRARVWPLLLALGSFLVQGYGSSLPPVLAVLAATAAAAGRDERKERRNRGAPRPGRLRGAVLAASLLVLALFWCGTAIDELTRSPGNLSRMLAHYTSGAPRSRPSVAAVLGSLSRHLAAPWLHGLSRLTVNSVPTRGQSAAAAGLAAALVALLPVCAWLAARRGQRYSAALCSLCLITVAAALPAARQLDGDIYPYVFFWLSSCAAVGWIASLGVLASAATALAARPALPARPARQSWLRGALAHREVALLVLALALALYLVARPIPVPHLGDPSVGDFAAGLEQHLAARGLAAKPVRLVSHDFAWPWSLGLLIQLDHRGHRASIGNVQGTARVAELQGLGKAWLTPVPGSTELHLYDRDPGPAAGFEKILCHPVLPLDATKPEMCLYRREKSESI